MKKYSLIIVIAIVSVLSANGQNSTSQQEEEVQTLFGSSSGFGGFIGFGTKAGDVNGQSALFVGGQLSAVFGHRMNIGIAGYGLATRVKADSRDLNGDLWNLDMGYGGLMLEPVIAQKKMVHLTFPLLLGVGGAGLRDDNYRIEDLDEDQIDEQFSEWEENDVFLVVEPGLNFEINLLQFVRLDLGATYRYVYDNNLSGLSDKELSGFAANVCLKLGWF